MVRSAAFPAGTERPGSVIEIKNGKKESSYQAAALKSQRKRNK